MPTTWVYKGLAMAYSGRYAEAEEYCKRAEELGASGALVSSLRKMIGTMEQTGNENKNGKVHK